MNSSITRPLATASVTVTDRFYLIENVSYKGKRYVTKNNEVCATFLLVYSDGVAGDGDDGENDDDDSPGGLMMGTTSAVAEHLPPP